MALRSKFHGITAIEMLVDWVIPIVGGILTIIVLHRFEFRPLWALLLALPGMLVFQWTVLLLISGLGALIRKLRSRDKDS